ncbi:MAG TPA: hypothetical protein VJ823_04095 [Rhodanobacteraceae bacterium]|nr:hypothetical protein [Rhodanobacteraceae bacterium]
MIFKYIHVNYQPKKSKNVKPADTSPLQIRICATAWHGVSTDPEKTTPFPEGCLGANRQDRHQPTRQRQSVNTPISSTPKPNMASAAGSGTLMLAGLMVPEKFHAVRADAGARHRPVEDGGAIITMS